MTRPPALADAAQTWNRRHDSDEFLFGTAPNEWLRAHAHPLPPGGRVLCVADGEGRNSVWLTHLSIIELRDHLAALQEGQGHRGQSALIGMVARR